MTPEPDRNPPSSTRYEKVPVTGVTLAAMQRRRAAAVVQAHLRGRSVRQAVELKRHMDVHIVQLGAAPVRRPTAPRPFATTP